jgi:hypothetical protein
MACSTEALYDAIICSFADSVSGLVVVPACCCVLALVFAFLFYVMCLAFVLVALFSPFVLSVCFLVVLP